jgi:hypothetical protein
VISLEAVDRTAAITTNADDARSFENTEVAGGGGPAVAEQLGEVPRGQLRPVVRENLHDVAPDLVRQRLEDSVAFAE